MSWLYENRDSDQAPPGAYVWLGCLNAQRRIVSYMHSGSLLDDAGPPIAHVGLFSVGCVLFQAFGTEPDAPEYLEERDGHFVPSGLEAGLVSIQAARPVVQWPPASRFTGHSLRVLAERNRHGPLRLVNGTAADPSYKS
jgi:hypothetical protein